MLLLNTFCLGLVLFALPGNWLIVILTCLFAWWRWDDNVFSVYTLIAIVVLAVVGELFEFFGGMAGAKTAGARFAGSIAALFGGITGAIAGTFLIPLPLLGTLIGACGGAAVGTLLMEFAAGRTMDKSARMGVGAGLGEFIGITSKLALGFVIWLIVAIAAFWP